MNGTGRIVKRRRIVHVPGLERLPGGPAALPAAWSRLLARSHRVPEVGRNPFRQILGTPLPPPAVLARMAASDAEPHEAGGWCLRFDPIALQPDLTAVWVRGRVQIDLAAPEREGLVNELQGMFAAENMDWAPVPGAGCGVISLAAAPDAEFAPLERIAGARLDDVLPRGPGAGRWCRLINESQMVFHQFRSLSSPDPRGLGLWFWGGGPWPPEPAPSGVQVVVAHSDVEGEALARWFGGPVQRGPEAWLRPEAETIVLRATLATGGDPVDRLRQLHDEWIGPLGRSTWTLVGDRTAWEISPLDRLAFWRRHRLRDWTGSS